MDDCPELGTEGQAADWDWEEVVPRQGLYLGPQEPIALLPRRCKSWPSRSPRSSSATTPIAWPGSPRSWPAEWPVANHVRVVYPKSRQAGIPLAGKTRLVFWSKHINSGIHCLAGPASRDHALRIADRSMPCSSRPSRMSCRTASARRGPTGCIAAFPAPPPEGSLWRRDGELPTTLNYLTIEFGPAGSQEVIRLWIDAMAIR